jgi:hypothetical protein
MRTGRCVASAVLLTACGSDAVDCVQLPCAIPLAVMVTVTSTSASQPLSNGVFVKATAPGTVDAACPPGPTALCYVPGTAGTYQLQIGATGFQTVMKTVEVTGQTPPRCGCPTVNTVHLDVALAPQ